MAGTGANKRFYYLYMGTDLITDRVTGYRTKHRALGAFLATAKELAQFGQEIEGRIHVAPNRDAIVEDADFVLSLGPRGGVKCERC